MAIRILVLLLLVGCKVGPDYRYPYMPLPETFVEAEDGDFEVPEDDDLLYWWRRFNDPKLDQLLEEALYTNFDYLIALEKIAQARAVFWTQWTQLLPEFDSSATATRFRTSQSFVTSSTASSTNALAASTVSPYQDFFQIGLAAIWELDVWGKFRRQAASAKDLWEASEDDARGVKLMVLSEIASTYISIAAFHEQLKIAEDVIASDEDLLHLAKQKFAGGLAEWQLVLAAESTLASDIAAAEVYSNGLKQSIYSLAVLLDKMPAELLAEFEEIAPIPNALGQLPYSFPGDLLRRRPDIRSAERQLASATEQIGVAVADLYPTLSLAGSSSSFAANPLQGANVGFSSPKLNELFDWKSRIWGIGGFVTFPVFDWGKRAAQVDVQAAIKMELYWNYQKTVIQALQETEKAIASYKYDARRLEELQQSAESLRTEWKLKEDLYKSGLVEYSTVLQAKEIWETAVQNFTLSQQSLAQDLISIYKALGGDWL
jgi:multidrug efflux system outer membrane protein